MKYLHQFLSIKLNDKVFLDKMEKNMKRWIQSINFLTF